MKSPDAFRFTDVVEKEHKKSMATLLQIDAKDKLEFLLRKSDKPQKTKIDETIKDLSADPTEAKDRALLALFDALFDRDVNLIDTEYLYRQFELYIKYDSDKLLSFLRRKKAQNPSGFTLGNDKALEKCREAELFVEMAFIQITKDQEKTENAVHILVSNMAKIDIGSSLQLAIEYNFMNELINQLIKRANK